MITPRTYVFLININLNTVIRWLIPLHKLFCHIILSSFIYLGEIKEKRKEQRKKNSTPNILLPFLQLKFKWIFFFFFFFNIHSHYFVAHWSLWKMRGFNFSLSVIFLYLFLSYLFPLYERHISLIGWTTAFHVDLHNKPYCSCLSFFFRFFLGIYLNPTHHIQYYIIIMR